MVQRSDESVALAIFCRRHWRLRFDNRIDTANCDQRSVNSRTSNVVGFSQTSMGDFSGYLEEDVVLHLPRGALSTFTRHCGTRETGCTIRDELRCLVLSKVSSEGRQQPRWPDQGGAAEGVAETRQSAVVTGMSFGERTGNLQYGRMDK